MPEIKVGDYLFRRLHELGIRSVFGVPGDYELALLDLVTDNELAWKGSSQQENHAPQSWQRKVRHV